MPEGRLAREIKKRKPFESLQEEVLLNLLRTHEAVQIAFTRLFREHGLTSSQYNVLRILRGEGAPLPSLEIASRMIVPVPAITGLLDRLEEAGLVSRDRCREDRRVVFIRLTDSGRARLAELDGPLRALHRRLVGHLGEAELQSLNQLLERARESESGAAHT